MSAPQTVNAAMERSGVGEAPAAGRSAVLIALFSLYFIWGSTYLAIRYAIEGMPPFMMAGARFLLAGGALYMFMRVRGAPRPTRKQWLGSFAVGALLLAGGNGGVTFAEQHISSGLAALVVGTVPLWAALFSGLWGKWPRRIEWVGLGLGFGGVALLSLENDMSANPLGAVVLFAAPIMWAFGSIWGKRLNLPAGLMSSAAEMVGGGVVLVVLSLLFGEQIRAVPGVNSMLAFVYLVVFGSLVAFSAYNFLLRRVSSSLATSYAYANPVVAVGLGVGLAGEHVTWFGLVAMVLILAGVAALALARGKAV